MLTRAQTDARVRWVPRNCNRCIRIFGMGADGISLCLEKQAQCWQLYSGIVQHHLTADNAKSISLRQ